MSNTGYFYKGINLNQIYVNNGNTGTISGYSGIPNSNGNQSNYSGMNPLSFGYNSGNMGLYNQVTAHNTIITTTVLTSIDSNNSNVSNYIQAVDSNLNTIINTIIIYNITIKSRT